MSPLALLGAVLAGAVLGLDVVSFPQAMLSRPIVAATVGGALFGRPISGLLAGAVLELISMETLPVGASRYPEWGTASLVGGILAAAGGGDHSGAVLLAVAAAIVTAWAGGWSMYLLRRLNGVMSRRALPAIEAGDARAVVGLQLRGLTADLVRGAMLTTVALLVWHPLVVWLLPRWSLNLAGAHAALAALGAAVAGSAVWRQAHGAGASRWWLVGGLAAGIATLVLR